MVGLWVPTGVGRLPHVAERCICTLVLTVVSDSVWVICGWDICASIWLAATEPGLGYLRSGLDYLRPGLGQLWPRLAG